MRLRQGPPDFFLFVITLVLILLGLIMVLSASAVTAAVRFNDAYYFFKKQLLWAVIGLFAMMVAMRFNYEKLKELAVPLMVFSLACLVAVLLPGLGKTVKGSTRQLGFGFASFTPSELAKLAITLFFSRQFAINLEKIKDFTKGLAPQLLIIGTICLLVMLQPDLGTTFVIAMTAFVLLLVAGARWEHIALLAALGLVFVVAAIFTADYRVDRFLAFLDPWKYSNSSGFQTIQSLYALGSGGLFGVGLGRSRQKFFYLPEQHTDFIFAILGEELGFLGVSLVLILFLLFAWRGFRIAWKAPDFFGSLLASGITSMIVLQAAVNIGVVSGSLPVTGIPLPFISFGGSSLIFTLTGVGLLLNISRYSKL